MKAIESDDPRAWFVKAEADLLSAEILLQSGAPVTGMVCYHCQQSAEKFLKGYLTFHQMKFKWVHDLEYLIELCAVGDDQFNELKPIAACRRAESPGGDQAMARGLLHRGQRNGLPL